MDNLPYYLILLLWVSWIFNCTGSRNTPYPDTTQVVSHGTIWTDTIQIDTVFLRKVILNALKDQEEFMDCEDDFGSVHMEKVVSWRNYDNVIDDVIKKLRQ